MNTVTLPSWASAILNAPPARGCGLNRWLLKAAIALRRCDFSPTDIESALFSATAGEPLKAGEIARAVGRSADYMSNGFTRRSVAPWPALVGESRQKVIDAADGYGAADLFGDSPWRIESDKPLTEVVIDQLFPSNPLLCAGSSLEDARTQPRETWRGRLEEMQFIVPSAMSKPIGINKEGKPSARCLDNTGGRCFLVVEQDQGTTDEQAAILRHLATKAPLVLAVRSGGKSLHGWFRCAGASDEHQRRFFANAVRLGADPATWTRCQFVRMPDGWRPERAQRQSVLFFSPEVCS
jgi:hypothetical protein